MNKKRVWIGGWLVLTLGVGSAWCDSGIAHVQVTASGSNLSGTIMFQETPEGLRVSAHLMNVPPGKHGFHIHEFGLCDEAGKAAGGHYNPLSSPHGLVTKAGLHGAHAGDLGNITADENGHAMMESVIPDVTLSGHAHTVGGRAVIVHEKADDFSQPVGNAGGRIGCGVIVLTSH